MSADLFIFMWLGTKHSLFLLIFLVIYVNVHIFRPGLSKFLSEKNRKACASVFRTRDALYDLKGRVRQVMKVHSRLIVDEDFQ